LNNQLLLINRNDNDQLDEESKKPSSLSYHTTLRQAPHLNEHAAAQPLICLDHERMGPQTIAFLEKHNILQKLEEDARKFRQRS